MLNPNEMEARLVSLLVRPGQRVSPGDTLCILETTKSVAELQAEAEGYVAALAWTEGQMVRAGEILCYLADSPDWAPAQPEGAEQVSPGDLPAGLRITQPALALARKAGLDLARLPADTLVTESVVRAALGETIPLPSFQLSAGLPAIIVYGGGGHGKTLIDLLRSLGTYQLVGVVDDSLPASEDVLGVPVLGGSQVLSGLRQRGIGLAVNAVGGIADPRLRVKVFERLREAGFACPTLAHPSAWIEASAALASGAQVLHHAYVGSNARVGFGVIVNSGAVVSHDCVVGDYANLSPGALLAGGVRVEEEVLIGMGATVNLGVTIGAGARIGNGATVKANVPAGQIVRAGSIWPDHASARPVSG